MSSLTAEPLDLRAPRADAGPMDDNAPWHQDFGYLGGVDLTLWVKLLTALIGLIALGVALF